MMFINHKAVLMSERHELRCMKIKPSSSMLFIKASCNDYTVVHLYRTHFVLILKKSFNYC